MVNQINCICNIVQKVNCFKGESYMNEKKNNGAANQCMDICCICGGVVNLSTSQALSLDTPIGIFRTRFHSTCFKLDPTKANRALLDLYEQAKKA